MRYAVIGDVHANLEALTAVLQEIDRLQVDKIVCVGDLVGYHADPNECVALIRQHGIQSIAGNHDRAAINVEEAWDFGPAARHAILRTGAILDAETRSYLKTLPSLLQVDPGLLLVHGALHPSPNDKTRLNSMEAVGQSFGIMRREFSHLRCCFYGHTHEAVIYERRNDNIGKYKESLFELRSDAWYLINPGSVGQPRDGNTGSAFLVYDQAVQTIQFHRVPYDRMACHRKAIDSGLAYQPSAVGRVMDQFSRRMRKVVHAFRGLHDKTAYNSRPSAQ